MQYGLFPIDSIKNAQRHALKYGTFAIGAAGLSLAIDSGKTSGHLFLEGEQAFTESTETDGNEQVAVLPSPQLFVSIGRMRPATDFKGYWPVGWICIPREGTAQLAFTSIRMGGQTQNGAVDLQTGKVEWDIDNLHRYAWVSDWELFAVQDGVPHSLARHSSDGG